MVPPPRYDVIVGLKHEQTTFSQLWSASDPGYEVWGVKGNGMQREDMRG